VNGKSGSREHEIQLNKVSLRDLCWRLYGSQIFVNFAKTTIIFMQKRLSFSYKNDYHFMQKRLSLCAKNDYHFMQKR